MSVAIKSDKSAAEEFARVIFMSDPHISIDEVARSLDKERYHRLHKSELSRIRIFAKQQLAAMGSLPALPPQIRRKPDPFNPPRLAVATEEPTHTETVEPQPKKQEQPIMGAVRQEQVHRPSSKKERTDFLFQWADEHPAATIAQARAALIEKFGMAVGIAYIATTMKLARQVHNLEPKPQEKPSSPPTTPVAAHHHENDDALDLHSIQGIAKAMKLLGLTRVELKDDGHVAFEAASL